MGAAAGDDMSGGVAPAGRTRSAPVAMVRKFWCG